MVLEHLDALCLQGISRHEGTVRRRAILVEDEPTTGLLGAATGDYWQEMVSNDPGVGLCLGFLLSPGQ